MGHTEYFRLTLSTLDWGRWGGKKNIKERERATAMREKKGGVQMGRKERQKSENRVEGRREIGRVRRE